MMCNGSACHLLRMGAALAAVLIASAAPAAEIQIKVTNNQPNGGFAFTPVWFGMHNGSFNLFTPGSPVNSQVVSLAERGDTGPLSTLFNGQGVQTTLAASSGAFLPGSSASTNLTIGQPSDDRYLSFGAMVVPSNDLFLGSSSPTAFPIFDASGNFLGPLTIQIFGANVWDANSEVLDVTNGAAFIQGEDATKGTQIQGNATLFLTESNASSYLTSILGITTAAGYEMTHAFNADDPIATIQISSVPEPASVALLGLGMVGVLMSGRAARTKRSNRAG